MTNNEATTTTQAAVVAEPGSKVAPAKASSKQGASPEKKAPKAKKAANAAKAAKPKSAKKEHQSKPAGEKPLVREGTAKAKVIDMISRKGGAILVREHAGRAGVKAHVHRCRHVEVAVTFNNETVHHRFSPATTVARVKHWAAVTKFKMTEAEASEHVLQIVGTHDRPAPGTHLGTLAKCPHCEVAFSLVPDQRVNGVPEAAR